MVLVLVAFPRAVAAMRKAEVKSEPRHVERDCLGIQCF